MKKSHAILLLTFTFSLFTNLCSAQYTILRSFNGPDGLNPQGSLLLAGNVLYGMSGGGGANGDGCIYSIHTDGSNYIDLFDFNVTNGRGAQGSLILSGKTLFGMAEYGGLYGWGNIFSIDTNGNNFKVILNFDNLDGGYPRGTPMLSGTKLFGMTSFGGINNKGEVFTIDTSGNNFKDLHDFDITYGEFPYGNVVLSGKTLFGMASGGGAFSDGMLFSVDTTGGHFKDMLDFNVANGKTPEGSLTLSVSGEVLYGMTDVGGLKDSGCVFKIDTSGAAYRDLLDFGGLDGNYPPANYLTLSGNVLYGMTTYGGVNKLGVIFSIDTDRTGYKKLFDFSTAKGAYPGSSLTMSGNTFYGTTTYGGAHFDGVVFKFKDTNITTSSNQLSVASGQCVVYPNPSNGIFTLITTGDGIKAATMEVFNVLGERVFTRKIRQADDKIINLSNQPKGIYFYNVISADGSFQGKGILIIQK